MEVQWIGEGVGRGASAARDHRRRGGKPTHTQTPAQVGEQRKVGAGGVVDCNGGLRCDVLDGGDDGVLRWW